MTTWTTGNAVEDTKDTRGWLVGHFIDPSQGVRRSDDVEVKWGVHPAGEKREQWSPDDRRTALVILVSGHFVVQLTDGSADLVRLLPLLVRRSLAVGTLLRLAMGSRAACSTLSAVVRYAGGEMGMRTRNSASPHGYVSD